jgi:hypothetical protein
VIPLHLASDRISYIYIYLPQISFHLFYFRLLLIYFPNTFRIFIFIFLW